MNAYKSANLFNIPDELKESDVVVKKKRTSKKIPITQRLLPKVAQSAVGQGFLPGLSRRGRPRLAIPISAVDRTAEHRRQRIANGAKRVEIILDSDISTALDRLGEHHQEPRSEVIATLIRKAAARLKP